MPTFTEHPPCARSLFQILYKMNLFNSYDIILKTVHDYVHFKVGRTMQAEVTQLLTVTLTVKNEGGMQIFQF